MAQLRAYASPVLPPLPSTSAPPALPGVVSSIRQIKRLSAQLADEATLLRRFTYKNKNQFKGCGWWRKIIEVDRVTERVGTELDGLLSVFGKGGNEKDGLVISAQALVCGLLRLPRSMLLMEKYLSVLLRCASILEQLVHSRAFLPFAVVVVALVARLHSLSLVLTDELNKAARLFVKRVENDQTAFPPLKELLRQMPQTERRRLLATGPEQTSLVPSSVLVTPSGSQSPAQPAASGDEFGEPVARPISEKDDIKAVVSRLESVASPPSVPFSPASTSLDDNSFNDTLPAVGSFTGKKPKRLLEDGTVSKKKKKKKKGSDILALFD